MSSHTRAPQLAIIIGVFSVSAALTAAFLWRSKPGDVPAAPSGPASAAPSATSASTPAARSDAPHDVLVWAATAADDPLSQDLDSVRTWWLSTDGDGTRVTGSIPGVVVLHDGKAWRWTPVEKEINPCVCNDAPVAGKGVALGADLVSLDGERVQVIAPPDYCNAEGPAPSITLLATIGSMIFVRTDHTEYGCGAHGIAVPQFLVWDLASKQPVDLLHAVDTSQARSDAMRVLAPSPLASAAQPAPAPSDLELVTLQPAYDQQGHLVLQGGFKTWACHACTGATSFVWGQYSRGVLVPLPNLPDRLRPFDSAPAAVTWFLAANPDWIVGGWSAAALSASLAGQIRSQLADAGPWSPGNNN